MLLRSAALAFCLAAPPLAAQTAAEIEAARQAFDDGHHALALTVLVPAARAGDADAQNVYGVALRAGEGAPQDAAAAIPWFEKAIAQGHTRAMHNLARLYQQGAPGVPRDLDRAAALYEQAVAAGYAAGGTGLGLMYEQGEGVEKDIDRALALYRAAAEAGESHAMFNLGNMYRTGTGVPEDLAAALGHYTRAALAGNGAGWNALGLMFENGMGTPVSPEAAYIAYMKAVEAGLALGGINAGHFVTNVEGWWQDPVHGYGYCLWGINTAPDALKEGFVADCEALVEYLSIEEEDAAKRFAEQIDAGS